MIFLFLLLFIVVIEASPVNVSKDAEYMTFNASRDLGRAVGWGAMNGGVHGGNGGGVWTVWDGFALRNAVNSNERRIVYVRGRIDLAPLFTASPGVRLHVGSFTSIIGGDNTAEITGGGLRVNGVQQVIIQNIKFNNALSYAPGEQPNGNGGIINLGQSDFSEIDAIEISRGTNVWVDHCEFSDDPWNANARPRRHDGLIDIVRGSDFITISNSLFRNHDPVTLVGNGDNNGDADRGRLRVTFFANWYRGVTQRNPRVRFGRVHVLNNLYTDIGNYGIGVGVEASIVAERNVFINTPRAWGWPAGWVNGNLVNTVNLLVNSGFDSGIPANVDWNPWGTYDYRAIPIGDVESHVRRYAGVW